MNKSFLVLLLILLVTFTSSLFGQVDPMIQSE